MTEKPHITSGGERAQWMRLLSLAEWGELKPYAALLADTDHEVLRPPETGLVMLRGRMGATGAAFNTGEATVTRCAIRLADRTEGHAYILGRNAEHARTAAVCDALMQQPHRAKILRETLLKPLAEKIQARQQAAASKAAATKVDFFTLVRGDD